MIPIINGRFPDTPEYTLSLLKGEIPGHSMLHKFGACDVGTTVTPVTQSGVYETPTSPVSLEFVSDSAFDNATGTGAREITVIGLGADWKESTQTLVTNGTSPVSLGTDLLRLHRWYVSSSGTYSTFSSFSHVGNLIIRVAGAGATWTSISKLPVPVGQSLIGGYTIPADKDGYLASAFLYTDSSKIVNIYLFVRENANDTTAPYSGIKHIVEKIVGISGGFSIIPRYLGHKFMGPCDVVYAANVSSGTAEVSVDFDLLLVNK